jgi:hypothetical protein
MGSYRKKRSSPSYISSSRGRHDDKCFAPNTICNNALEKAYLSNGQAIYSMYCSFHTCARRSPDGRFCGRAKYPAQRFCPDRKYARLSANFWADKKQI